MSEGRWYGPLLRPMAMIAAIGVASRLCQALAGLFIAHKFGATIETDAYMLAKSVPIGAYLIADSLLYNSLVPVYRGRDEAKGYLSAVFLIGLGVSLALAAAMLLGAAPLLALLAPGSGAETRLAAAGLLRITGTALLFAITASLFKAINASRKHYVLASLDGFVMSGVLIVVVLLTPAERGIAPVAAALPAACFLLLVIQAAAGRRDWSAQRPDWKSAHLSQVAGLVLPLAALTLLQQVNVLFMNAMASFIGQGSISCLNYSYAIAQIPVSVLDLVFFSAVFPFAAALAKSDDVEALRKSFMDLMYWTALIAAPAAVWLVAAGQDIVGLVLEHGRFDATATDATVQALAGHAIAIPFWTFEALGCRYLFALKKHWRYFGIVAARLAINFILCLVLAPRLGILGVSAAFALSFAAGAALSLRACAATTERLGAVTPLIVSWRRAFQIFFLIACTYVPVKGFAFAAPHAFEVPSIGRAAAGAIGAAVGLIAVIIIERLARSKT